MTFTVEGATLGGSALAVIGIPAASADAQGRLRATWTVPAAPAASVDAAPRGYVVEATGAAAAGGRLVAYFPQPLVVYPGTAPCAVADTAVTTLGRPVRIPVLANDVAPQGGSLDVTSVQVTAAAGGRFAVDSTDGSLTFTPDPGFAGTAATHYVVFDNWGVGVRAEVTVTVNAGCTITGAPGVVRIDGTDGDDVICVGDRSDRDGFHIIDAGAGNDVILGGAGIDWIRAGPGADTVYGADGADRIDGGAGTDTIFGGGGFDTIYSTDRADTVHDADHEIVVTAPLTTPAGPVAGDDKDRAAVGEMLIIDVLGNDFDPDGDLDASSLSITAAPTVGSARVVTTEELGTHVAYTAPSSDATATFTYRVCDRRGDCATAQVTVTVGTSHCTIIGTPGNDILRGTPGDDVICGLGGHDVISGLGGNDVLWGGPGNDTLYGFLASGGGDGRNSLFGGTGHDTMLGGDGDDTLWGGAGVDSMWGNGGADTLNGGPGNDTLNGDGGDDTLWGGLGDDILWGFPGDDRLIGGEGTDYANGGPDTDTCQEAETIEQCET